MIRRPTNIHSNVLSCPEGTDATYLTCKQTLQIDDYAKDGGPGEVSLLCSFYHESLRTWIKTIVNKFATSNHTALILGVHALRSYLNLICEYALHSLPNKKVSGAKDHGKNYIKVRPPPSAIFCVIVHYLAGILTLKWPAKFYTK